VQVKPAPPESHFDLFKMDKLEYLAQTVRPTYTTLLVFRPSGHTRACGMRSPESVFIRVALFGARPKSRHRQTHTHTTTYFFCLPAATTHCWVH